MGVTVFFTLSGYLITGLLLGERERTGAVDLARFYARRARRLLPALFFFLAVMAGTGLVSLRNEVWTVAYVANLPLAAGGTLGGLSHTWSLALEEQFYLVWPVVLILLARRWGRRGVAWGAGVGAAVSVAVRVGLWLTGVSEARLYFGPDVRADALLIGCCAAAVGLIVRAPRWVALAALVALVPVEGTAQTVVLPTLVALLSVAVIGSPTPVLTWLPLRYLGWRSYALYLWHFPLIFLVAPTLGLPHAEAVSAAVGLSWVMAEVSWWAVERPFLRDGREPQVLQGDVVGVPERCGSHQGDHACAGNVETADRLIGAPRIAH